MWAALRPGSLIWASAWLIRAGQVVVGDRPRADGDPAATRCEVSWPPAVATVTPWTLTPATFSARSTAWAMASDASSRLMIEPPRTPRDWT